MTGLLVATENNFSELLLARRLIDKAHLFWPDAIELHPTWSGFNKFLRGIPKDRLTPKIRVLEKNQIMDLDALLADRKFNFVRIGESVQTLLRCPCLFRCLHRILRQVVTTQGNVLARRRDRASIARSEDVVRCQHQQTGFQLRFHAQRNMHRHLITVEIRIVSRTNQRMNSNGVALDQLRLESLHRQPMERRGAIQ